MFATSRETGDTETTSPVTTYATRNGIINCIEGDGSFTPDIKYTDLLQYSSLIIVSIPNSCLLKPSSDLLLSIVAVIQSWYVRTSL